MRARSAGSARLLADPALRARMSESGRARAEEFSWERITGKVEAYYGFVIRRLAAQGALPPGFHAEVPPGPARPGATLPSAAAERDGAAEDDTQVTATVRAGT